MIAVASFCSLSSIPIELRNFIINYEHIPAEVMENKYYYKKKYLKYKSKYSNLKMKMRFANNKT